MNITLINTRRIHSVYGKFLDEYIHTLMYNSQLADKRILTRILCKVPSTIANHVREKAVIVKDIAHSGLLHVRRNVAGKTLLCGRGPQNFVLHYHKCTIAIQALWRREIADCEPLLMCVKINEFTR